MKPNNLIKRVMGKIPPPVINWGTIICMFLLISPSMLFSQSGEKYSVNMNSLGPVDKFGSSNYAPVRIFTNSTLRALFTADGDFEAWYNSYFKKNVNVDSSLTAWEIFAMYRLSVYGDVVVTGIMKSAKLILTDGNITSMTGTVDFGSNNLSTTGNVTAGSFNSPTFAGNGKGLITYDLSGTLGQLQFTGNANKVLLGDGTWGGLPIPQNYWQLQGVDLYTLTPGNVGIGMNNPVYKLDIAGTVRISEDLLVGGGIVISEKVNATKELKSASLRADSIVMDSTKAFYGESRFADSVKIQSKLRVFGNVDVGGNITTTGNLTFGGDKAIGFIPAANGNPDVIYFATPPPNLNQACLIHSGNILEFDFPGIFQTYGTNSDGNTNLMSMGFNGTDAVIETGIIEDNPATIQPKLFINKFCGKDVHVCNGNAGGNVYLTSSGKVGIGTQSVNAKLHVKADSSITGLIVETVSGANTGNYGIISKVDASGDSTIAIAVLQDTVKNFLVFGNGHVQARDVIVKLTNLGDFIFDDDYALMTIYELENYIKNNKRLPKMPSAKEVAQKGKNLGEFQNLVLQKTEEQALYIIFLKKEIDTLKKEIEELKNYIK